MNDLSLTSRIQHAYELLVAWASKLQSPLLLAIRLYWGWQFCQGGWGKLHTHGDVTEYFMSLNIPLPGLNAWIVGITECFGGLLLLAGLGARLVALPLIGTMVVAYLTAEWETVQAIFAVTVRDGANVWTPDTSKFVSATPFLFLLACLIVLAFGPGVFSIDFLLAWRFGRRRAGKR